MAKVEILKSLLQEIDKKFKNKSIEVLTYIKTLEKSPQKGKLLGSIGNIVIKELRYKGFRFYFLVDGHKLKALNQDELVDLLLRFVRMSNKKYQQKIIDEIKHILRTIGPSGFE
jgi:hypothetical protein